MKKKFIKLYDKFMSASGGLGLSREFKVVTFVHVLLMLGISLSSVFISVFLFKMNGSDYVLTAKYNAYLFFFEGLTFILCLYFYKYLSVVKTMQIGLCVYSLSYIILLIFRNDIINYYIIVAALSSTGAGLYWTGYYLMTNVHTTPENRQRALGFNGICCYIVSIIASPISGFITSTFEGMTGYIIVFGVTIIAYLIAAFYIKDVPYISTERYNFNFHNSFKYILKTKATRLIYISETFRGIRLGMTFYYTPILLYSITSNEFILGIALMLKNLSSILSCNYMKTIKTAHRRFVSTAILLGIEIVTLFILIANRETNLMVYLAFFYCSFYVIVEIIGMNLSQIPLFETMILLKRHCGTDREFMGVRQLLFNGGRTFGVIVLLFLPTEPIYQLIAICTSSVVAFIAACICNKGAKLVSEEVANG
ncbi:MAG: MFS transporter [Clostridia bacterium]